MDLYSHTDYRMVFRERLKELQSKRRGLSFRKIAAKLGIQYTYLSKCLNDAKAHLNEDHFFLVCQDLEFEPEQIDFLLLLRDLQTANNSDRKKYVSEKINAIKNRHSLKAKVQEFGQLQATHEMKWLLDPFGVLIYVALHLDQFAKTPEKLCAHLGISKKRLVEILRRLEALGFAELNPNLEIRKLHKNPIHYSKDHPLMRVHQHQLRALCNTRLLKLSEEEKTSLMFTFTTDERAYAEIRRKFYVFLEEAQKIAMAATNKKMYQMNFDFFIWTP